MTAPDPLREDEVIAPGFGLLAPFIDGLVAEVEVEAVARAIYDDCHGWFDERLAIGPDDLADTARAAITALDQVREGRGK